MTDLNQYLAANGYATLEDWGRDSDYRQDIPVSDYETLSVIVTGEGVIFDAYDTDGLVATMGMTFAEWFAFIANTGESQ